MKETQKLFFCGVFCAFALAGLSAPDLAQQAPAEKRVTTKVMISPLDHKPVGLVLVDGRLFALLPGIPNYSPERRVGMVKKRLVTLLRSKNPLLSSSLSQSGKDWVVKTSSLPLPESSEGLVVTVDPYCADLMREKPQEAAGLLSRTLSRMIQKPGTPSGIKSKGNVTDYLTAWGAFNEGKVEGAIKQCKQLIGDDPAYVSAYLLLLACYEKQGDYDAMAKTVDALTNLDSHTFSETEGRGFWLKYDVIPKEKQPKLPKDWTPRPVDLYSTETGKDEISKHE